MAYNGVPKGNEAWALVLGFSVAVAALFYGLWLISPTELNKVIGARGGAMQGKSAMQENVPPPPPPPLPALFDE